MKKAEEDLSLQVPSRIDTFDRPINTSNTLNKPTSSIERLVGLVEEYIDIE
jgi:hypothetical protein